MEGSTSACNLIDSGSIPGRGINPFPIQWEWNVVREGMKFQIWWEWSSRGKILKVFIHRASVV